MIAAACAAAAQDLGLLWKTPENLWSFMNYEVGICECVCTQ